MDNDLYLWLKSNIENYTFTGESCGVKEEFCELFSANESVMDFKDLNQVELCYDMLVYNFYNNIAGYRNGFADCEITSENLDCYFLETSEGILPIGYYKSIRPVEASMLTQEFIDAGIAKIPDKKRELNEEWKMQASIVKEKYEEVSLYSSYHPDYKRVKMDLVKAKEALYTNELVIEYKKYEKLIQEKMNLASNEILKAISNNIK